MSFSLSKYYVLVAFCTILFSPCHSQGINESISSVFKDFRNDNKDILTKSSIIIEKALIDSKKQQVTITMPKAFAAFPFRNESVEKLYNKIASSLPDSIKHFSISVIINDKELEYYIPNYFRSQKENDKARINKSYKDIPLITNDSKSFSLENSLKGRHIALWSSHGYYFEPEKDKWQWQRPKLYGITEDSYTASIVIPYLLPMLENAGAITLTPKERDFQTKEVIVDNDDISNNNFTVYNSPKQEWTSDSCGFANSITLYHNDNPFINGSYLKNKGRKNGTSNLQWIPNFPSTGEYGVYISYKTVEGSTSDAHYTVYHSGGKSSFSINQKMGGGTWIYLGKFKFLKGRNDSIGKVVLTNKNKDHGIITADAVRFGGGMGNVARSKNDSLSTKETLTSGMPRYLEAARYWLQWAGFHDSIYNTNKGKSEYKDDYMSRALWVNDLIGGSMRRPGVGGKNIPIDAALAIHSDAGVSENDQIIGSLAIYMTNNNSDFSNGTSKAASRDLADLIQSQTVEDINKAYNCNWTRRKLADESYFEARVPDVPTLLLETLSHQNFQDMKYGLDPHFRFIVARAIYKGLLKFFSSSNSYNYIVQPLPIKNFSAEFFNDTKKQVFLSWKEQEDKLEPTATPTSYILYTSKNSNGFDNGTKVNDTHITVTISPDTIYSFKVTAVNNGGESFPSEVLSVAHSSKEKGCAIVVNGFERVSGPMSFNSGNYQGFLYNIDPGVAYKNDISHTGRQYDFSKKSEWTSNETPGIGASHSNYEDAIIAGNTFNYPFVHGQALLDNNFSFVSCSLKALEEGNINLKKYKFVDLLFGNQKETQVGDSALYKIFNENLIDVLSSYLEEHGNLLLTGQYIGSDVVNKDECDSFTVDFIENKLHYTLGNINHKPTGEVTSKTNFDLLFNKKYTYFIEPNRYRYNVTCPDAIIPVNEGKIVLRHDSQDAAGIMYNGKDYKTIVSTIPFETIKGRRQRNDFMKAVIDFFNKECTSNKIRMVTLPARSSVNTKSYTSTKKSYKQDFYTKKK